MDIKAARSTLGLFQRELAEALGVSTVTVSRWERGFSIRRVYIDRLRDMLAKHTLRKDLDAQGESQDETPAQVTR